MQTTRSFFQKDVINFIRNSLKSFDYEVHDVKEEFPIKNTIVDGKFFITDIRTRQPFTVIIEADGPEHHMFSCRPATLTKALTFSPTSKTSRTRLRDEIMQSKTSSSDPRKPMYYVTIDLHEWQNAPTKQLRMSLLKEKLTALP